MEEATLTVQSLVATQPLLVGLLTGVVVAFLIAYFIIKRRKPKNEPEETRQTGRYGFSAPLRDPE